MGIPVFSRLPEHIGVIPDGNRRWAQSKGLSKEKGYKYGLLPGIRLYELCLGLGIKELTFYGFTRDNTKRPSLQTLAFRKACVEAVEMLAEKDASLMVLGDSSSPLFPPELMPYTTRTVFGKGLIKINFLVNYSWKWDLCNSQSGNKQKKNSNLDFLNQIESSNLSRINLVIRWGGRRRLSGFLPVQTVYSDFFVVEDFWPDFQEQHFFEALAWYQEQDITLGG